MEAHPSVMPPPVGVTYPLIGFTVTTPCAPLPAGTLLGATVLLSAIVDCGLTARTVSGTPAVVNVVLRPLPLIVMPYATVLVSGFFVTGAGAGPRAGTTPGLTPHTWG